MVAHKTQWFVMNLGIQQKRKKEEWQKRGRKRGRREWGGSEEERSRFDGSTVRVNTVV